MTSAERKRAKSLKNNICILGGKSYGMQTMAEVILLLIMDAAVFFATSRIDELYTVIVLHTVFMGMFNAVFMYISEAVMGTRSIIPEMGNGSAFMGKFLCTLPFEGKDRINVRIADWEKMLAATSASTAAVMIALEIAGGMGFTKFDGIVGITVAIALLINILALMINFLIKNWYLGMVASMSMSFLPVLVMLTAADENGETTTETALEFSKKLEAFSFLSGVSGVIILAVITAALILCAEAVTSRMKKTSWKFR